MVSVSSLIIRIPLGLIAESHSSKIWRQQEVYPFEPFTVAPLLLQTGIERPALVIACGFQKSLREPNY